MTGTTGTTGTASPDVVVVGAGLAGLVAATEAADRGARVLVVEQEGPQSIGAQAFWSLGGLFMVDTPEQRRMRVRDSLELARRDWMGSAQFDRPEDHWPRAWAEAYLRFAAGEMRPWLHGMGMRWFPVVGWAERGHLGTGAAGAGEHGNSVPRFHLTWGTGPGVVAPFERRAREAEASGRLRFAFRHRVDRIETADGRVTGVSGVVLADDAAERGKPTNRTPLRDFSVRAPAVVVASGGIGGDLDLVRRNWPADLGTPPRDMVAGVPAHVDGRMLAIAQAAGGRVINPDRMWHYTEGLRNWDPIWEHHGIRVLPGPSSLWLDAAGNRLPAPGFPGFDTRGTLRILRATGYDTSWFILTQRIIEREFALSGSEQNPDITGKSIPLLLQRLRKGRATGPVEAFKEHGADFVVAGTLAELVAGMNAIKEPGAPDLDEASVRAIVEERDRGVDAPGADRQVDEIRRARAYLGDRLVRTASPHRILDPDAGPLIAVQLRVLSRKTLGGLETDLDGRCLRADGTTMDGLLAAGEASGFGGGGMMGWNALEGTFLGGCILSGRQAGRAAAGRPGP